MSTRLDPRPCATRGCATQADWSTDRIGAIFLHPDGATIRWRDQPGPDCRLSGNDVEMLRLAFPSECEACGFNPDSEDGDE